MKTNFYIKLILVLFFLFVFFQPKSTYAVCWGSCGACHDGSSCGVGGFCNFSGCMPAVGGFCCAYPTPTPVRGHVYHPPTPIPTNAPPPGSTPTPPPSGGGGAPPPGEPTPTPLIQCVTCSGTICLPDALGNSVCGPAQPCPDASCPTYCIPGGVGWGCGGGENTSTIPSFQFNPNNETDNDKYDIKFNWQLIVNRTPSTSEGSCNAFTNVAIGPDGSSLGNAESCDDWASMQGLKTCTASGSSNKGATNGPWEYSGGKICAKTTLSFRCPYRNAQGQIEWTGTPDAGATSAVVCTEAFQPPKCQIIGGPAVGTDLVVGDQYGFTTKGDAYDLSRKIERVGIFRAMQNNTDATYGWHSIIDDGSCSDLSCTRTDTWDVTADAYHPEVNNGVWCVVCNAYYNDSTTSNKVDQCTGNAWSVPSSWSDCDEADSDERCYRVVNPTPPPSACSVGGLNPAPGCYRSNPALSATYSGGANQGQINIYGAASSYWLSSNPFSYTNPYAPATGTYYWSALPRSLASPQVCTTPNDADVPQSYYSIDVTAPTPPVTPACSYNSSTKKISFSWSASRDVGCAQCSGAYACNYWLQQFWSDGDWTLNDGEWTPANYSAPSYASSDTSLSCVGRNSLWANLKVKQAKDGLGNISASNSLEGSCQCPTPTPPPPCTVSNQSPTSGCSKDPPTLSALGGQGADKIRYVVPGLSQSDWLGNPTTYVFSDLTGTSSYSWYATATSTAAPLVCREPDGTTLPRFTYDLDRTAPTPPVTPACSYNSSTKKISFSWSASRDVGCAQCSGAYACNYWLQQFWSDGDWTLNDGEWTPANYSAPSYASSDTSLSCVGRNSLWANLKVKQAKDSVDNISASTDLYGSCQCPTPPPCTISGQSPTSGCFKNPPTLFATYGGGANEAKFVVPSVVPGISGEESSWLSDPSDNRVSYTFSGLLDSQDYSWYATAHSTAAPPVRPCEEPDGTTLPRFTYDLDRTAPTPPVQSCSASYDAGTKNATISWNPSHDDGCLNCSTRAARYWLRGKWNDGNWFVNSGEWAPTSCIAPSYAVSCDGKWGYRSYLQINQAKDNYAVVGDIDIEIKKNSDNESDLVDSGGDINPALACEYQCPTPTAYPTVVITGTLKQHSGTGCYSASPSDTFANTNISVDAPNLTCITPACSYFPNSSTTYAYKCEVKFDNQGCVNLSPPQAPLADQNFTLMASAQDCGSGGWDVTSGQCAPTTLTQNIKVDGAAPTPIVKDIIFDIDNKWFKLKHGSFQSSNQVSNIIPPIVTSCGADDGNSNVLVVGSNEPGVATGVVIGANATYSDPHNWGNNSILSDYFLTPSDILSYVKSRKQYSTITVLNGITDGISIINGDLTINNSGDYNKAFFNDRKLVLIVDGNVIFNAGDFTPSNASIAIIATGKITFASTMASANGIFMASTVDTGSSAQCFQVNGSLIATTALTQGRQTADTSKPSLFVFFKPNLYVDLLRYLSVSKYEWRQLQ